MPSSEDQPRRRTRKNRSLPQADTGSQGPRGPQFGSPSPRPPYRISDPDPSPDETKVVPAEVLREHEKLSEGDTGRDFGIHEAIETVRAERAQISLSLASTQRAAADALNLERQERSRQQEAEWRKFGAIIELADEFYRWARRRRIRTSSLPNGLGLGWVLINGNGVESRAAGDSYTFLGITKKGQKYVRFLRMDNHPMWNEGYSDPPMVAEYCVLEPATVSLLGDPANITVVRRRVAEIVVDSGKRWP